MVGELDGEQSGVIKFRMISIGEIIKTESKSMNYIQLLFCACRYVVRSWSWIIELFQLNVMSLHRLLNHSQLIILQDKIAEEVLRNLKRKMMNPAHKYILNGTDGKVNPEKSAMKCIWKSTWFKSKQRILRNEKSKSLVWTI